MANSVAVLKPRFEETNIQIKSSRKANPIGLFILGLSLQPVDPWKCP